MGLIGNLTTFVHTSDRWFFELCNEENDTARLPWRL